MKSRVIFASLILGLGLAATQADAATTISIDDSSTANKTAATRPVDGSEKQFTSYIEQNVAKFAHSTNWQNLMSVVSLYNQSPATVLTISPADRAKFNEAVAQLNTQLARQNDAEASHWSNLVNYQARMINFLWNANQSASELPEIQ